MKGSNEITIFPLINALSKFHPDMNIAVELGDNCIKNLRLRRCIVGYAAFEVVYRRICGRKFSFTVP